jgi:hypothetical protein
LTIPAREIRLGRMEPTDVSLLARLWNDLGAPSDALASVSLSGPTHALPSLYEVGALASACVAAATLSVALVRSVRTGEPIRASHVSRTHAAVAFRSERYLEASGWSLPAVWDPLAGDYRTRDGWIRLHTNYRHHRDAALRVLRTAETREAVTDAARGWSGDELEAAVVGENGCAARLRSRAEWDAHPQGKAVAASPIFDVATCPAPALDLGDGRPAPLAGVRVLDLTRVLAGPVCTRFLSAYGADVLRIDPPGFEEVGALVPETTVGKRRAVLDLKTDAGRRVLERLVAGAHVMVHGYRADALERLGLGAARRRELNPALVDVSHDAYGFSGPWSARRGFDSLVQMSAGIADRGREAARADRPVPLPAQALDHGCGYLLAAAACRALVRSLLAREATTVRLSLARTAKVLTDLGDGGDLAAPDLTDADVDRCREDATTAFGRVRRVRCPGRIEGFEPRWSTPAGPLGSDPAVWR